MLSQPKTENSIFDLKTMLVQNALNYPVHNKIRQNLYLQDLKPTHNLQHFST